MNVSLQTETKAAATVPDDLQLITSVLYVISSGGGMVAAGYMNRRDVGRGVGGVGVRVLIEGVVP